MFSDILHEHEDFCKISGPFSMASCRNCRENTFLLFIVEAICLLAMVLFSSLAESVKGL